MAKRYLMLPGLLVFIAATVFYWLNQNPPGVTMIDPARPPAPVLEAAEVEKIRTLQSTKEVYLLGPVSPDDTTVIVMAGPGQESAQVSWLDLETGQFEAIDPKLMEFEPQGEVAWSGDRMAVYLSSNVNGDPVLVRLSRGTGGIQTEILQLQGRPLSLAPDGSRLLVENGTQAGMELYVQDLETGNTETLLSYPGGSGPMSTAWTSDGGRLALVRYQVPAELAGKPDKIAEFATQEALGRIPLEQNLYLSSNLIDIFDLDGGVIERRTLHARDGDGYLFKEVSWSPDGQLLMVKMSSPSQPAGRAHPSYAAQGAFAGRASFHFYDAGLNLVGNLDRPETEAPMISSAMFISPQEVIVTAAHGLSMRLFSYHLQTEEFRMLPAGEGTFAERPGGFQVFAAHHSRKLVYNQSSFQHPAEVYLLDLEGSAPLPLSHFNAGAAAANQVRVDEVSFQLDENTVRTGYLIQPAGASFPPQHAPVVIHHQGGPGGAMTNRWGATADDPFNLLPNFGISVLFMPFSGREGFGPDFYLALADENHFGQIDVDESALAAQYLLDHGYAGNGQVGVNGCSYGGYLVSQSITQYPELYAAAVSQCSIMDLNDYLEFNQYLVTFYEGSLPVDRPEEYRRDSPLHNASAVRTPVLLMQGVEDFLPVKLVRDFRNAVERTGTPVELLVFQNEGHGLSLPESRLYAAQQQISWLRKYLGP